MQTILSFSFGIIPAIIWLIFWLKEDKKNPEPKRFIFLTFIAGMLSAMVARYVSFDLMKYIVINPELGFFSILLFASTEEIIKYIFAYFSALKRSFDDEPIDAIIYMITVALGFAAMENTLYLWNIFSSMNEIYQGISIGNMRFIGATTLHIATSGIIGIAIALSFYKNKIKKRIYLLTGIILAIALHTTFNFLIINDSGGNIFKVFIIVWLIIIFILIFFEKIKKLKKPLLNKFKKIQ